jgi:hypothetical protein
MGRAGQQDGHGGGRYCGALYIPEDSAIIIRPEQSADVTLDERLSRFDPVRHGGHNGNEKIRIQYGLKFACNYHSLLISEQQVLER